MDEQLDSKIAIIGIAGEFPKSKSVSELWNNLLNKQEGIRYFSDEEIKKANVPSYMTDDPNYVPAGGTLDDITLFDADFFGYAPREVQAMDPQHRLFLEHAWHALEDAGYSNVDDTRTIAVYGSAGPNFYMNQLLNQPSLLRNLDKRMIESGNQVDFLTTKVSYKLGLKGPSIAVQTACSSSLVGVHLACQSLLNGECDMAISGGVSIECDYLKGYVYQERGVESPDGHCKCFDENAKGFAYSDGVGIVVLKRLEEAIKDCDHIYAVISGSAINNDGFEKAGYTAPSITGQANVISEAIEIAGMTPNDIGYVEAHGSGTFLGDQVEVTALREVFKDREREEPCYLGSIKANNGHMNVVSGIAGLIKATLVVKNGYIPAHINFQKANPKLLLEESCFCINKENVFWENSKKKRVAGVSSFGIGGTNAHVIVEEPPRQRSNCQEKDYYVLPITGRCERDYIANRDNLVEHLQNHSEMNLQSVGYTLQKGRKHFAHRGFIIMSQLELSRNPQLYQFNFHYNNGSQIERKVCFLFQPIEQIKKVIEVCHQIPLIKKYIDEFTPIVKRKVGFSIEEQILRYDSIEELAQRQDINITMRFIIQYAIAKFWIDAGINPDSFSGDIVGQFVAACIAEVFSAKDALHILCDGWDGSIVLHKPCILLKSSNSRDILKDAQVMSGDYWCNLLEKLNEESNNVEPIQKEEYLIYLNVGNESEKACNTSYYKSILEEAAELWSNGIELNWRVLYGNENPIKVSLPLYAFHKKRFWIDDENQAERKINENRTEPDTNKNLAEQNMNENLIEPDANENPIEPVINDLHDVEQCIINVLKEILGNPMIDEDSNFIKLGGSSLIALQFSLRMKQYNIDIPYYELVEHPVVSDLAQEYLDSMQDMELEELPRTKEEKKILHISPTDEMIIKSKLDMSDIQVVYPLSFMQMQVLYHNIRNAYHGNSKLYSYFIEEDLEIEKLKRSWQKIIDTHTILRTGYMWRKIENPVQFVKKKSEIVFNVIDWTNVTESTQHYNYEKFMNEESTHSFRAEETVKIRFFLIKLGVKRYYFVIEYENSLFDGWSLNIILRDLRKYYYNEENDWEKERKEDSYFKYISWLTQQKIENAEKFFVEEYRDFPLDDYKDMFQRKKQGKQTVYEYAYEQRFILEEQSRSIAEFCEENNLTMNSFLTSAWALAYAVTWKLDDFLIGIISSGRGAEIDGIEDMLGLFTNTLPVRITLNDQELLSSWIYNLQKKLLRLLKFNYVTLQQISKWIKVPNEYLQWACNERSISYLDYNNMFENSVDDTSSVKYSDNIGQLFIPMRIYVTPGTTMEIKLEYDKSCFTIEQVNELMAQLQKAIIQFPKAKTVGEITESMIKKQ